MARTSKTYCHGDAHCFTAIWWHVVLLWVMPRDGGGHRLITSADGPSTVLSLRLFVLLLGVPIAQLEQRPSICSSEGPQCAG